MSNITSTSTSTPTFEKEELEELLLERKKLKKCKRNVNNYYGTVAMAYRMLDVMCPENNAKQQQFFTISDIGYYNRSRTQIHLKYREAFINKAIKAGLVREIIIPERIGIRWANYTNPDVTQIINNPNNKRSIRRLRNSKYYKLTSEGIRIYKNIKEVIELLGR